jgi:organic hydroperoxide reductase OsmC/OhrA
MTDEHHYELTSKWVRDKIVSIAPNGKSEFEVATPLDFWPESPPGTLSPEDLFLASAVSCYGVSLTGVAKR